MRGVLRQLRLSSSGRVATTIALIILSIVCLAAEPERQRQKQDEPPTTVIEPLAPERFFEQMFGAGGPQDDAALAKIEISLREERQIGDAAAQGYLESLRRRKLKVVNRGREVGYLSDLITTLQPLMAHGDRYRRIEVYYIQSDETDARSFPGGTLFFSRGLLKFAESEAALIGVVGHELSHLDRGHQLVHVKKTKLAQQTFTGNGGPASPEHFFDASRMLAETWMRPFRPEDESQADLDGATWAFEAGYDSREFAELLMKMHRRDGNRGGALPSFLRSHPFHRERYRALIAIAKQLNDTNPNAQLYIGRRNLEQRVARVRREFQE